MSRRRVMLMNGQEDDEEMRDWVTIVDTVTTEEIMNPSYSALPDGNKIEDYNFREVVVYVIYNANEAQTTSGYVRLSLTDIDGNKIDIIQYDLDDGNEENVAQFTYEDVFYTINATMEEDDFKELLKNLYFF